ncbi:SGNH hydrolase-type esterase domain-containing protein [Truncatella angustata]|uniref:SGNH hydrolase-type esterase domain-containing protein n=1 Tax=Truncatella angustata TaxID=152316 RepID=A0A9P8UI07_9PEZI|nr:SGNH hydrolase-type esterase domain-containing protein [Truncatella angustata]KAH6652524.1 SGNH hydrolase-type esterase domain-containing protein [Truncatella angustata]KAH8198969.1 hypothetical protein TruAng_006846 [Truncatella angustata]
MRYFETIALLASLGCVQAATVVRGPKDPYFLLVGDSTTAPNGGWGDAFSDLAENGAEAENRGKSGSTTISWKTNGRWDDLLETVANVKADYEPVVTVQFGHNDQKSLTLDEYRANLLSIATDLKEAGATPILVTPLTRRNWVDNELQQDFKDWRGKVIAVAKEVGVKYLDLTLASTKYVKAIGEEDSQYYNLSEGDGTHLNEAGGIIFSRIVADLLLQKRSDFAGYLRANEALSDKIGAGRFATGDE